MSIVLDLSHCYYEWNKEKVVKDFEARYTWCRQKASEYLAAKERKKHYYVQYYDNNDNELDTYYDLPQELVDNLLKKLEQEVIIDGPFKDKKEEIEIRREIIQDMDDAFIADYLDLDCKLSDIDPDDFIYYYKLNVCRFDPNSKSMVKESGRHLHFTDEEYIQILTELLCAPFDLSFDGLRMVEPDICDKIMNGCSTCDYTTVIFLTEMNEDVKNILEQCGGRDKIPKSQYISNYWNQSTYKSKYNSI